MPTAQLPAHLSGKVRNVAGLVFDDNGQATYTTLSAQQTLILSLYGANVAGVQVQNPPPAAPAIFPAATQFPTVNTATATTSAAIDSAIFPASGPTAPTDGVIASDPTAKLLLVRQAGKWYKTAALTVIT
jgi:hypothetical protein